MNFDQEQYEVVDSLDSPPPSKQEKKVDELQNKLTKNEKEFNRILSDKEKQLKQQILQNEQLKKEKTEIISRLIQKQRQFNDEFQSLRHNFHTQRIKFEFKLQKSQEDREKAIRMIEKSVTQTLLQKDEIIKENQSVQTKYENTILIQQKQIAGYIENENQFVQEISFLKKELSNSINQLSKKNQRSLDIDRDSNQTKNSTKNISYKNFEQTEEQRVTDDTYDLIQTIQTLEIRVANLMEEIQSKENDTDLLKEQHQKFISELIDRINLLEKDNLKLLGFENLNLQRKFSEDLSSGRQKEDLTMQEQSISGGSSPEQQHLNDQNKLDLNTTFGVTQQLQEEKFKAKLKNPLDWQAKSENTEIIDILTSLQRQIDDKLQKQDQQIDVQGYKKELHKQQIQSLLQKLSEYISSIFDINFRFYLF